MRNISNNFYSRRRNTGYSTIEIYNFPARRSKAKAETILRRKVRYVTHSVKAGFLLNTYRYA